MNSPVFLCSLAAALPGLLLPSGAILLMLIIRRIRLVPFLKGAAISIVLNLYMLPVMISFLTGFIPENVRLLAAILGYSALSLGFIWIVLERIFPEGDKKTPQRDALAGYILVQASSLMARCFQTLVLADHLRLNDIRFLQEAGLSLHTIQSLQLSAAGCLLNGLAAALFILLQILCFKTMKRTSGRRSQLICGALLQGLAGIVLMTAGASSSWLLLALETAGLLLILIQIRRLQPVCDL